MEKSLFFLRKNFLFLSSLEHPFFLEIRKLVPCHKRQIIEESQNDFPSFLTQHYEKIAEIGKGAQGRVYKVREKSTQQIKAMKCMKTRDPELISQVKKKPYPNKK